MPRKSKYQLQYEKALYRARVHGIIKKLIKKGTLCCPEAIIAVNTTLMPQQENNINYTDFRYK